MDHAAELAATLRQLAANENDFALADALIEAVAKIERFADYKLRNQAQSVIGDSYITLQERLDAVLNIGRDTHQLVMSVQSDQQTQGAAVNDLREAFRAAIADLGKWRGETDTRLDGLEKGMKRISGQVEQVNTRHERQIAILTNQVAEAFARLDAKRDRLASDEARIDVLETQVKVLIALESEVARIATELAARPSPAKASATYDGVRRILEHLGLADDAAG